MTHLVAVVDDEPRIRELLALELEELGVEVLRCADGKELLTNSELQKVELVLLDWVMPGLDGLGTLHALRNCAFKAPIIVVTALSDPQINKRALQEGAAAITLKTDILDILPQLLSRGKKTVGSVLKNGLNVSESGWNP